MISDFIILGFVMYWKDVICFTQTAVLVWQNIGSDIYMRSDIYLISEWYYQTSIFMIIYCVYKFYILYYFVKLY